MKENVVNDEEAVSTRQRNLGGSLICSQICHGTFWLPIWYNLNYAYFGQKYLFNIAT
jgi:hypothetical protein